MTGINVSAYLRLLAEDGGGANGDAVELDLPPVGDRPGNRLGLGAADRGGSFTVVHEDEPSAQQPDGLDRPRGAYIPAADEGGRG